MLGATSCRSRRPSLTCAEAARCPALVVDGDGVESHVRVGMLDVALEDRDVAAEAHWADAPSRSGGPAGSSSGSAGGVRVPAFRRAARSPPWRGASRSRRPPSRPRRSRAGTACRRRPQSGRGPTAVPATPSASVRIFRKLMFSEPGPPGTHLTSSPSQPWNGPSGRWGPGSRRSCVFSRKRVHRVQAQRMLDRRALGAVVERLVGGPGAAGSARRRGSSRRRCRCPGRRVLLVLGHLDVAEDRLKHALARNRRLRLGGLGERVAEVLAGCRSARRRGALPASSTTFWRSVATTITPPPSSRPRPRRAGRERSSRAGCPSSGCGRACRRSRRRRTGPLRLFAVLCVDHEASVLVVEDWIGEDQLLQRVDAGSPVAGEHVREKPPHRPPGPRRVRARRRACRRGSGRLCPSRPRRRSPATPRRAAPSESVNSTPSALTSTAPYQRVVSGME